MGRKKSSVARLSLACALGLASVAAAAGVAATQLADESDPQKLWALVIGVSSYAHAEPLLYASTDAQSFADFLRSPRGGSLPEDHVFTLLESKASRYELLVQIESLQDTVQDGDTIYIYIAGHGFINRRGIGYFIPSDGDLKVPAATAVPFSSIKELIDLGLAHAKNRILITDICHSGRIGPEKSQLAEKIQNLINAEFLKLGEGAGGTFLNLLASRPSEPSWESDELGHGVFTYALLEALNGKGGTDAQKLVRAENVVDFVRAEVPRWTGNQQNPMANDTFNPELPLADLERPGPEIFVRQDDTILLIDHADKTPYIRAQWVDPKNESIAVRQLPKDQESVPIPALAPGVLEVSFFDSENKPHSVKVNLEKGENHLDARGVAVGRLDFQPGRLRQVASLAPTAPAPAPFPQSPSPAPSVASQSTLLLRVAEQTQIFVDGAFYGTGQGLDRLVALQGLPTGVRQLRLLYSPEHEQRRRVKLFKGAQIFDPASGEIQPVPEVSAPPQSTPLPVGLPSGTEEDYRRFEQALWEGNLIAPAGESAWDYYQRLQGRLQGLLAQETRNRLVAAMGDRAQQTVLKYLRGGDVRWEASTFEEGAELIDRVQRIFRASDFYESQERFFRGRALIERGQYPQALAELQRSTALDAEASHAFNAQGLAYWKAGQLDLALPPLDRAIQLTPRWSYPRITRSLILLERRRYQEAEQGLREALEIDPEDSFAAHALGQVYFLEGQWRQALSQVQKAIEFHPGNAYAYQTLGILQQRLQRFDEAESSLRLAIRLEPSEPAFRLSLAELYRQLGRVGETRRIFAALLDENPESPDVWEAQAKFLASSNRPDEAERAFSKALELAPEQANLRVSHGIFLRSTGKKDAAVGEFRRALKIDPGNAFAHHQLAEVHFADKKLSDAEKEAREAVRDDPRYAPPYRLLGQLAFARQQLDEALEAFRQARDLSIEPYQKQELQDTIDQVESVIVDERLAAAAKSVADGRPREAWEVYASTLGRAPDSKPLRNRMLEFLAGHPTGVDPGKLPDAPWAKAVKTDFWAAQDEAEREWAEGRTEEASRRFAAALDRLSGEDLRSVTSTAFNFGNEEYGVHAMISRWGRRLLLAGRPAEARGLVEKSMEKMIFAAVPNYSPLTIDSLMTPDDSPGPEKFEDFEVAHHPDRRAHEILAAAAAVERDLTAAVPFLEAIDAHGLDLRARNLMAETLLRAGRSEAAATLLSAALGQTESVRPAPEGSIDAYLLLARIQCERGDCRAARATLERGLRRIPGNPEIQDAIKKTP